MSRTIRRKHHHAERDALRDFVAATSVHGGTYFRRIRLQPRTRAYEEAWWEFHRDHYRGKIGVPRWFRAQFNRTARRQEEQALVRELGRGVLDVVLKPRVRDAAYAWY